jgi:RND family efflux transporter MFP subunit
MKRILIGLMALIASLSAQEIYATFNIEAHQSANLAFFTGGVVDKVNVDVSTIVKKGDNLVELQNNDLKASLRMAKAALDDAEVTLKFAKKDYERQVLIKDLIDEAKFDQYELAYERAKVATAQAKANYAYQKAILERSIILAPFDGIIFEKSVEIGDVVSGLSLRTILKIQSKSKRKLIFEFDQKYWKSVKVGDSVKYSVNGDENSYTGKISKLYPHANSDNRKIKAEVITNGFVVGLFGEGYITIPDVK